MLHEHAAALSAASPANRSRGLIKCAKIICTLPRAENMGLRRHHYLIEGLREHRRGKKGDRRQRILAGVLQIVTHQRRQDEDAARPDCAGRAVLEIKLAGAGDDVLRFFGSVSVPPEPAARLDFVKTMVDDAVVPLPPKRAKAPCQRTDGSLCPQTLARSSLPLIDDRIHGGTPFAQSGRPPF